MAANCSLSHADNNKASIVQTLQLQQFTFDTQVQRDVIPEETTKKSTNSLALIYIFHVTVYSTPLRWKHG